MIRRLTLLLLLSLLVVGPAWAQETPAATPEPAPTVAPTKKVELISPVDQQPLTAEVVEAFQTSGVDPDFCYIGASESYYQKLIVTDPRSGYTGYVDDFFPELKKPLSAEVLKKIKRDLPKRFDLTKLEPWDRYEIMARIYIWRGLSNAQIANAYLRATYTMRGLALGEKERKREIKLRKQAIKYFKLAMANTEFKLAELPQLKYLIGELHRRNGKFSKAIGFFDDAGKMKNRPEWLDEMLIRQKARAFAYDDS